MQLQINNFQSIVKADLTFDGFTVITGKSNLGKSAVRRAFATLLYNDWKPHFVRNGTKTASLIFKEVNKDITIEKGDRNSFTVNGRSYAKIGTDTPDEYIDFGWGALETQDKSYKLNVSTQLEPLFMTGYSDTENTKILNAALRLDVFEEAVKLANTDLSRKNTELKLVKTESQTLETEIQNLKENKKEIDEKLEKAKELHTKITEIENYRDTERETRTLKTENEKDKRTLGKINELIKNTQNLKLIKEYIELAIKTESINRIKSISKKAISKLSKLQLVTEYIYSQSELSTLQTHTNNLNNTTLKLNTLNTLTLYINKEYEAKQTKRTQKRINKLINNINTQLTLKQYTTLNTQQTQLKEETTQLTHTLNTLHSQLHTIGVCPMCQGKGRF